MLVYLLVVTLSGVLNIPDFTQLHLEPRLVTHSFALAYHDRVAADLAVQRIRTRWADALHVTVTAELYQVCVPAPETLPCAGAARWIRVAPPVGLDP